MQRELEENQKSIAELSEQLKKLEDEAGEVMKDCQEAEVGTFHPLCFPFLHRNFFFFHSGVSRSTEFLFSEGLFLIAQRNTSYNMLFNDIL